jgi:hypothetical protein
MKLKYECHGHIILDGESYHAAMERHKNGVDAAFIRSQLSKCAKHGITFYRDGGDKYNVSATAKAVAAEYGIDYRTPVFIIHRKGYYGSMFGRAYESMKDYLELVREAKRLGADFYKVCGFRHYGLCVRREGNRAGNTLFGNKAGG